MSIFHGTGEKKILIFLKLSFTYFWRWQKSLEYLVTSITHFESTYWMASLNLPHDVGSLKLRQQNADSSSYCFIHTFKYTTNEMWSPSTCCKHSLHSFSGPSSTKCLVFNVTNLEANLSAFNVWTAWRTVGIPVIDVLSLCCASTFVWNILMKEWIAVNWFRWNTFSRNFLITKGNFDWDRKDYSFENIHRIYPTTGKSDNHLAYTQYPWNCKTLSVIQF